MLTAADPMGLQLFYFSSNRLSGANSRSRLYLFLLVPPKKRISATIGARAGELQPNLQLNFYVCTFAPQLKRFIACNCTTL